MSRQTIFAAKLTQPLSSLKQGDICCQIAGKPGNWRISSQLPLDGLTIIEQPSAITIITIVNSDQYVLHIGHTQNRIK